LEPPENPGRFTAVTRMRRFQTFASRAETDDAGDSGLCRR
jgi:hypothetical protein